MKLCLGGAIPIFASYNTISAIAFCCRICVFVFSFLSAYGLTKQISNYDKKYLRFIIVRYLKLVSTYWVTLLCLWAFYKFVLHDSPINHYNGSFLYMLEDFFSVSELFGHTEMMFSGVFWYMNYAIVEIFVIPIIIKVTRIFGWYIVLITAIFYNVLPTIVDSMYGGNYNMYIFSIEIGVLFAETNFFEDFSLWFQVLKKVKQQALRLLCLIVMCIAPYLAWYVVITDRFGITYILHTVGAIALIMLVFSFYKDNIISSLLEKIGVISGDIYLLHVIVFRLASSIVAVTTLIPIQFMTVSLICIVISVILRFIKEKSGYNNAISLVCKYIG